MKEKQKGEREPDHSEDDRDQDKESNREELMKRPWYKPTTRHAPRTNAALELFIEKSTNDPIATEKRRKIKDNMTKGQRQALGEMRRLPLSLTHGLACRYADKSGNTVITSLEDDDAKILKELHCQEFYDVLPENPTEETCSVIRDWAVAWSAESKITEDIVDYVTNL